MKEFNLTEDAENLTEGERLDILKMSTIISRFTTDCFDLGASPSIIFSALVTSLANFAVDFDAETELAEALDRLLCILKSDSLKRPLDG